MVLTLNSLQGIFMIFILNNYYTANNEHDRALFMTKKVKMVAHN